MAWLSEQGFFGLAYVVVATAMWATGRAMQHSPGHRASVWFGLAYLAFVAAVLRWTSAGNRVSDALRDQARESGWYDDRATVQLLATVVLVGAVLVAAAAAFVMRRRHRARALPLLVSIGFAASILIASVRVVSLHQIDSFVTSRFLGIRVLALLEGAAVAATLVGILRLWRSDAEPDRT